MKVYYTNETYGPSRELKFRIRKLAEIAALAKLCNQTDLYNQAKQQHDTLVSNYNSVAKTKEKGFWGQFLDNLTNTSSSVIMAKYLESDSNYQNTYSLYSRLNNSSLTISTLKSALNDWERGWDSQGALDM